MHGCVLNSLAVKIFGVTNGMKTTDGGIIQRKPGTDEPYGLIMETAYLPIFSAMPKPSKEQLIEQLKDGQMLKAEAGITTAQEGTTHKSDLDVLSEGAKQNKFFIDVIVYPFITDLSDVIKGYTYSSWGNTKVI